MRNRRAWVPAWGANHPGLTQAAAPLRYACAQTPNRPGRLYIN